MDHKQACFLTDIPMRKKGKEYRDKKRVERRNETSKYTCSNTKRNKITVDYATFG